MASVRPTATLALSRYARTEYAGGDRGTRAWHSDVSSFFRKFGGEDIVVRPADAQRSPFQIEVCFAGSQATFAPSAPVYQGDIVERADPRGGVIEYRVAKYEINRDPFGHGNDHGLATLQEEGRASRAFAAPSITISGGTNQVVVGDGNVQVQRRGEEAGAIATALATILQRIPDQAFTEAQMAELQEAVDSAADAEASGAKPTVVKRALHGVRGVIDDLAGSARSGVGEAVKSWATASTAAVLALLSSLS